MVTFYDSELPEYGEIMTVKDFKDSVSVAAYTDYDGVGHPSDGLMMCDRIYIKPSKLSEIPDDATHIVWFNK